MLTKSTSETGKLFKNQSQPRRYKIAFLSQVSPYDQRSWSGITFYLNKHISEFHEVTWISPSGMSRLHRRLIWMWNKGIELLKKKFTTHSLLNAYLLGVTIEKKIKKDNYDFIVVGAGESELIAYLKTDVPIIYIADTTFGNMVDYYPWHTGLCKTAIRQGNMVEQRAIKNSCHIIYSSQWAANSAFNRYRAKKNKVSIVSFGANLLRIPSKQDVLNRKENRKCNLLFLGVSWERKGGPIAYKTFLQLKMAHHDCTLTIIGCNPELDQTDDLKIIPFIDKNDPAQFEDLYKILMDTDFLFIPTRADCTPIVFSEAAAFGIPVITTDTGGITSVIRENINGFCLPLTAGAEEYSKLIKEIWDDKIHFLQLRETSRNEYEERLNWQAWTEKFNQVLLQTTL